MHDPSRRHAPVSSGRGALPSSGRAQRTRPLPVVTVRGLALALGLTATAACARDPETPVCAPVAKAGAAEGVRARVSDRVVNTLGPEFFGFNLESTEFQLSLWDSSARQVHPDVTALLAESFPGAVYRFPGGLIANMFDWQAASGPLERRRKVKLVDWGEPYQVGFGLDEYRRFVKAVGGQTWYVANLRGELERERPAEDLAREAGALATADRAEPARFLRWELGNELDRADILWPYGKYIERARAVLEGVRKADPDVTFVGMLQDFDAQEKMGVKSPQYNRAVARALAAAGVKEFEQHYYYDDPPFGPAIPVQLRHLCSAIAATRAGMADAAAASADKSGAAAPQPRFWITEHGRWPQEQPGRPWKEVWNRTADMGAALGVADFLIAAAQVPEVRGAMVHSLHGFTGPWPLFHAVDAKDLKRGFTASAPLEALRVLRRSMGREVMDAQVSSGHQSGYVGGYDGRVSVMRDGPDGPYSLWAINRRGAALPAEIHIPALRGRTVDVSLGRVTAGDPGEHNYGKERRIRARDERMTLSFDKDGVATFSLPAYSVTGVLPFTAR